ncbi:hypothetical protein CBR_g793 [Chara braunii]|uniref:Uncharacterized protein n=1 Tax=Chara braunii TaxID=69332 RepID=A0A388KC69_CHABU|nr:hypothetical protein CBR_g793 [Chara braunii]|eukprot:GBG67664.1 hypothetical protein CBR_g793 [Chara braunii]
MKTTFASKGKAREVVVEDIPSSSDMASEVEAITKGTENLSIQEKCKRGEDAPAGDSLLVVTPAKRLSKRAGIRPVRLSDHLERTRTRIAVRHVTRGVASKALTVVKAPARDTIMERMIFLDNTKRELSKMDYDTLRMICRDEGVNYETKVQTIFDIADRRAQLRFGELVLDFGVFGNLEDEAAQSSQDEADDRAQA